MFGRILDGSRQRGDGGVILSARYRQVGSFHRATVAPLSEAVDNTALVLTDGMRLVCEPTEAAALQRRHELGQAGRHATHHLRTEPVARDQQPRAQPLALL